MKPMRKAEIMALVIILVLGAAWLANYFFSDFRVDRQVKEIAKNVPPYFMSSDSSAKPLPATAVQGSDYMLLSREKLGDGITQQIDKPYEEALKEYYKKTVDNKWVAIGGSKQTDNMTLWKLNDGQKTFFIKIEKIMTEGKETTQVTIIPVERNR